MAKLKCFTIHGIEMWFFPNDHLPPHFHAKRRGQWEVRVYFLESTTARMFSVVWQKGKGKGVPRTDTKLLEAMVKANRADILKEWEEKVQPDEN